MRKGFVFTLDAAFAATFAVVLVVVVVLIGVHSDTGNAFRESQKQASDAAVVATYTGKSASDFGLSEFISGSALHGACLHSYEYSAVSNSVTKKAFCGEVS